MKVSRNNLVAFLESGDCQGDETHPLKFVAAEGRPTTMGTQNYHGSHDGTARPSPPRSPAMTFSGAWSVASISDAVGGLLRRFATGPLPASQLSSSSYVGTSANDFESPRRQHAFSYQPPPLYPISLHGYQATTPASAKLLTKALAEEIRLLVPARLQLCEQWSLVYSLEEDGVSLGTLYKKCEYLRGLRNGFVLVVKDGRGDVSFSPRLDSLYTTLPSLLTRIVVWRLPQRGAAY